MDGELKAGRASATFSEDALAGTMMHLDWQWLTGDRKPGTSDGAARATATGSEAALTVNGPPKIRRIDGHSS
jgi:hypothetical protein